MTIEEAVQIIAIIRMNYPDTMQGMSDDEKIAYAKNWHFFFKDDRAQDVLAAVQTIISTSQERFAPNIGMIREQMRKNREPAGAAMTEMEAWSLVKNALRNGSYGYREEYAKLPPIIQRCLGSENTIREWAAQDVTELDTVTASNFMRSYRYRMQNEQEWDRLPEAMREDIGRIGGNIFRPLELEGDE